MIFLLDVWQMCYHGLWYASGRYMCDPNAICGMSEIWQNLSKLQEHGYTMNLIVLNARCLEFELSQRYNRIRDVHGLPACIAWTHRFMTTLWVCALISLVVTWRYRSVSAPILHKKECVQVQQVLSKLDLDGAKAMSPELQAEVKRMIRLNPDFASYSLWHSTDPTVSGPGTQLNRGEYAHLYIALSTEYLRNRDKKNESKPVNFAPESLKGNLELSRDLDKLKSVSEPYYMTVISNGRYVSVPLSFTDTEGLQRIVRAVMDPHFLDTLQCASALHRELKLFCLKT